MSEPTSVNGILETAALPGATDADEATRRAIIQPDEAFGREAAAEYIAEQTTLAVQQALAILNAAPRTVLPFRPRAGRAPVRGAHADKPPAA